MKKWTALLLLTVAAIASVPDRGEAFFRRRCRPVYCPPAPCCPVVVCPYAPVIPAAPAAPAVTIKRRMYQLLDTLDQGEFSEPVRLAAATAPGVSANETFTGTDRLTPKTTIVDAEIEDFPTVGALVNELLTKHPDADMKSLGIKRNTDTRVDAEKRNVRVRGFIHAFKKEGDNDYHVILGDGLGAENPAYLNVEVSGIPVGGGNANRQRLIQVRDEFKATLNLGPNGPNGYKRPHDPIPVKITGSLFWDVDHPPGAVGPSGLKPTTSWEIHPVSAIEFLDE